MRILFTQSGGFAGLVRGCRIDTASLPPDERRSVEALVDASGITGDRTAHSESARDLRHYEIRIERPGETARLCCDDDCIPDAARQLLAELLTRSRPEPLEDRAATAAGAASASVPSAAPPREEPEPGRSQASAPGAWGRFEGEVVARWHAEGREMTLVEPFAYLDPRDGRWPAPAGAVVDGASIPRAFWSFIGGPFSGAYRAGSVVHDVACQTRDRGWRETHRMFYEACRCGGVGRVQAVAMYYAVHHFGPRWRTEVRTVVVAGRSLVEEVVVDDSPPAPTPRQAAAVMAYMQEHDVTAADVPALSIPGADGGPHEDAPDARHPAP